MFVRLFVDENLDRMVPISKQPKEKIQAIIESCSRQFPEFQERARKRIRTYLKSCRRMKKGGFEVGKHGNLHMYWQTNMHICRNYLCFDNATENLKHLTWNSSLNIFVLHTIRRQTTAL